MIGKIVKGTSFSGCVNYVLKEDKSRLLKAVGVYGSPEEIAEQFELQTLLNDKVKNKVGHISLSFSAEDGDHRHDLIRIPIDRHYGLLFQYDTFSLDIYKDAGCTQIDTNIIGHQHSCFPPALNMHS